MQQLVTTAPGFAAAWREQALLTVDNAERLTVIDRGLAAEPDAETKGMLLLDKALVLERLGHHDEAVRLLGELALDPRSTVGTEELAKATLRLLLGG